MTMVEPSEAGKAAAARQGEPDVNAPASVETVAKAKVEAGAPTEPKPATPKSPEPADAKPAAAKPVAPAKPKPAAAPKPRAPEPAPAASPAPPKGPSAAEVARLARKQRARRLVFALLVWVGIPSLLGVVYYALLAADQYESVATLVIPNRGDQGALAATLLQEHVLSRDTLAALESDREFRAHFGQSGDLLTRLSNDAGSERRFAYYLDHVSARYEPSSRVFTLKVRAFSGAEARSLARAVLVEGQRFVSATLPDAAPFVVVAQPSAPDEATFPRRGYGILTVLLASLALFAIGSLLVAAVREHAQF